MKAALLVVGDELLDGRAVDTNSAMLAARLLALGVPVTLTLVVGDPLADTVRGLRFALGEADVVIVTGGLGPTADDRTREAVAQLAGVPLAEDAAAWDAIQAWFARRGLPVHDANRRQAQFPRGATVLANPLGTAPGLALTLTDGKRVFCVPGVPSEAEGMFDREVAPRLGPPQVLHQHTLCFGGVSESHLGALLDDLLREGGDVRTGITSSWGLLRVTAQSADAARVRETLARVRALGERWFIGEGYLQLEDLLGAELIGRGISVAVAESLTCGLVAARLGRVPGISAVLDEGMVTYSNESKMRRLAVPPGLVATEGAVSEACARAMAEGLAKTSGVRLAGSCTGIAGPGGGSEAKPVGLVWFATCFEGEVRTRERRFGDLGREVVRQRAAAELVLMLLQAVRG